MAEVKVEVVPAPTDARELVLNMLAEAEAKEKTCAEKICAGLKAVGMASKDLHYRAKGEAFYSEHLLADLGWQTEKLTDDFIEVYYLGDKGWMPPLMRDIYARAAEWLKEMDGEVPFAHAEQSNYFWAKRLLRICEDLVSQVEVAKLTLTTKAGTQAALDEISKEVLVVVGLLKRNLK